ncbi:MAG: alpha/beta hydrolase [Candidatus Lokiarchaeota archaeon]|nr:alpha/beta hydrolase [Candidatus Lokiarchaeota archaeon]
MESFSLISNYEIKISGRYALFPPINNSNLAIQHNILLIHAFPFDSEMFYANFSDISTVSVLSELGTQFGNIRVILPDLPGFGRSESFMNQPYDLIPYVDVIKEIVDFFDIKTLILGGCSMGGYIALEYLHNHPNSLDGLILIDTKSTADFEEQKQNRYKIMEMIRISLQRWSKLDNHAQKMEETHGTIHEIRNYLENLYDKIIADTTTTSNPQLAEKILTIMKRQNPLALIHALGAMAGRIDNSDSLQKFKKPVLIMLGEHDSLIPIELAKKMDSLALNATLRIIPNSGHLSNVENVEIFNDRLVSWLKTAIFQN